MKTAALFVTSLAAVSAFAPTPVGRSSTQINESLFDKVNDCRMKLDLFFRKLGGRVDANVFVYLLVIAFLLCP